MTQQSRIHTGQHFLSSTAVAVRIVTAARITKNDTVLEAGTGTGALVQFLCARAKRVISVESDESLHDDARARLGGIANLELILGDAFSMEAEPDVFVSSLPYSQSRRAFEWMAQRMFSHGAVVVQKEFATKLSPPRPADRRAISVIANAAFEIERVSGVSRRNFAPPPRVDSVILALRRRATITAHVIRTVNSMFSYRRKTLRSTLTRLGKTDVTSCKDTRLEELGGDEIVRIAETIES